MLPMHSHHAQQTHTRTSDRHVPGLTHGAGNAPVMRAGPTLSTPT